MPPLAFRRGNGKSFSKNIDFSRVWRTWKSSPKRDQEAVIRTLDAFLAKPD